MTAAALCAIDSRRWKRSLKGRLLQASSEAIWVAPCIKHPNSASFL